MFGDDPERIRSEAASWGTLRHLPHTCLVRTDKPAPALPRRAPPSQRGALSTSHRSHAPPPTHHRLRRPPHHRRPHQKRHHPLPQTVLGPRGLPTRHDRPPNPTTHGLRPLNPLFDHRGINALAESFFATLETELLHRTRFPTRSHARTAIFDYIEGFYNPHRRHSAIGYHSPIDYERSPQPPCG